MDAREVLERYPYWPHVPPGATPAQWATFALSTLKTAEWTLGADAAVARVEQKWDTEKLGVRAGRLVAILPPGAASAAAVVAEAMADAERERFGYLVTRVDSMDLACVQLLEAAGFRTVDAILSQYVTLDRAPVLAPAPGVSVRLVRADDADALAAIADASFTQSRFHGDPWIGIDRARALYHQWARNLAGGLNDVTLVAEVGGEVAGFLSALGNEPARAAYGQGYGRIELVAVAPAHRGKNVVRAMTAALLGEARTRRWDRLGIGTQIGNVRAIRAYQSAGFAPGDAIFTLRWLGSAAGKVPPTGG